MIYLLHGSDWESSYKRLTQILAGFKNHKITHLDRTTAQSDLDQKLTETSLFEQKEIIILENLLWADSQLPQTLKNTPEEKIIIIWEKQEIKPDLAKKLPKKTLIELYNIKTRLFEFLDSLVPGSKAAKLLVKKLEQESFLWHLQHRILLLLLAKSGLTQEEAAVATQKNILSWQWTKICDQCAYFSISNLLDFYRGALKVDYLIKTGKTNLSPSTLSSVLLLKYLKK